MKRWTTGCEFGEVRSIATGFESGLVVTGHNTGSVSLTAPLAPGERIARKAWRIADGPAFAGFDEDEAAVWAAVGTTIQRIAVDGPAGSGDPHADAGFRVGTAEATVLCACVNADNGLFITGDDAGWISLWRHKEGKGQLWKRWQPGAEAEPWRLVASAGPHVVAARHNAEVYVFDVNGDNFEVRTLSNDTTNCRQVRSLACCSEGKHYYVGFSDGAVQRCAFADQQDENAFAGKLRGNERVVAHKNADGKRSAVDALTPVPGHPSIVVTGARDGLCCVDMTRPRAPKIRRLLSGVAVGGLAATSSALVISTPGGFASVPWEQVHTIPAAAP